MFGISEGGLRRSSFQSTPSQRISIAGIDDTHTHGAAHNMVMRVLPEPDGKINLW